MEEEEFHEQSFGNNENNENQNNTELELQKIIIINLLMK